MNTSQPYAGHAHYTYAEITMSGHVTRPDGSTGFYTVPLDVIYPNSGPNNGVGVVDWVNSAFYHFFGFPHDESGLFQFTLLSTGSYLFDNGYTYASVGFDKAVFDIFGPTPPNDGQPHQHLAYGSLDHSDDAWGVFVDSATLLKHPSFGPSAVGTVFSSGYSQGAALQINLLINNYDPTHVYDGHLAAMIGLSCWARSDDPPHYGFLGACSGPPPTTGHVPVIFLVSESDMLAFGGYFSRNAGDPLWRQYELSNQSHLPSSVLALGNPDQNPTDPKPVFRAGFNNLKDWVKSGTPAPPAKYFDGSVDSAGNFTPVTDADGNWTGGLRLTNATSMVGSQPAGAPLGTYAGLNPAGLNPFNVFLWLGGTYQRFNDATLLAKYPTRHDYVNRVSRAATNLADNRYITSNDANAIIAAAATDPLAPGTPRDGDHGDVAPEAAGGCSAGSSPGVLLAMFGVFAIGRRRRRA